MNEYEKRIFNLEYENKFLKELLNRIKEVPEEDFNDSFCYVIDVVDDYMFEEIDKLKEDNRKLGLLKFKEFCNRS